MHPQPSARHSLRSWEFKSACRRINLVHAPINSSYPVYKNNFVKIFLIHPKTIMRWTAPSDSRYCAFAGRRYYVRDSEKQCEDWERSLSLLHVGHRLEWQDPTSPAFYAQAAPTPEAAAAGRWFH